MSESDSTTTSALPDVSPSHDSKKQKLFHADFANLADGDDVQNGSVSAEASRSPPVLGDAPETDGDESPVVTAVALPAEEVSETEEWWDLKMNWSGKVYDIRVGGNDMVYDFRKVIENMTEVPAERQKLIGLTKGKLSTELDSTRFGTLGIKKGCKFTMIGEPEALSFKDPSMVNLPDVVDDFDVEYSSAKGPAVVVPAEDPRNKRLLSSIIKKVPITLMNEPRPGKKLLVLDLDYTIVDTKPMLAGSLPSSECARPGLHEFLESVYPHYDIVIWSQTHWRWLETKLVELGILGGTANYKVCFVSDRTTMFPVFAQRKGQLLKHEVKPLAYFWAKFPQWSPQNTIHIDDLSRNFAMNPGEGLRIRAFHGAGTPEGFQDRELERLRQYLVHIATNSDDFTTLDHTRWKKGSPFR